MDLYWSRTKSTLHLTHRKSTSRQLTSRQLTSRRPLSHRKKPGGAQLEVRIKLKSWLQSRRCLNQTQNQNQRKRAPARPARPPVRLSAQCLRGQIHPWTRASNRQRLCYIFSELSRQRGRNGKLSCIGAGFGKMRYK